MRWTLTYTNPSSPAGYCLATHHVVNQDGRRVQREGAAIVADSPSGRFEALSRWHANPRCTPHAMLQQALRFSMDRGLRPPRHGVTMWLA